MKKNILLFAFFLLWSDLLFAGFPRIRIKTPIQNVWCLSIGINTYKFSDHSLNLLNCESDAIGYNTFFKSQFVRKKDSATFRYVFHEYILVGSFATKDTILSILKEIASKASPADCFIFNYSGMTELAGSDSSKIKTYFIPHSSLSYDFMKISKSSNRDSSLDKRLISLNTLQEYIQQIPATNQMFITEAGKTKDFKTELLRILMHNSPVVSSILNKNRIIIVPNEMGFDRCMGENQKKGPINYCISSLDSSVYNIYDIFNENRTADEIAYKIKSMQYSCMSFSSNYFDVFFEKQFLQQYKDIFGDDNGLARGVAIESKAIKTTANRLTAKRFALIVGTDDYKGKGWGKLYNPVKDAKEVADELSRSYGFEVQLLENKPMDSVYKAIRDYYNIIKPDDQLVVYFAGHGDVDDAMLSDGFVVCTDSKSIVDDPIRNSYISYSKLQRMLNNMPARQVLVLLDVCHGGTFDPKAFEYVKRSNDVSTITNKNVLQLLEDKLPLRTRKFLSSVGTESAFDGRAGQHSPFANLLLQVLRAKGSGTNGIVTLSDINSVLQTASTNETATLKISPHMADFGNVDAFSEFIFIPK